MSHFSVKRVYALYVVYFALVILGYIPRATVPWTTLALGVWLAILPLEESVSFFARAIPLFIAIPLTHSYDNLNMWRPLSLIIAARFLLQRQTIADIKSYFGSLRHNIIGWLKARPVFRRLMILLLLAVLSLLVAQQPLTGIKRIIYFLNLSLVPTVAFALIRRGRLTTERLIKDIATATIVVVIVGYLQLASTYLMDVYQFMRLWGEGIQMREFGQQWSYIAVWQGNTWLAYYGSQLSLRVFSLFPDSHSFPTFVLLGIPALFAIALNPILRLAEKLPVRRLVREYSSLNIVWVPLAFLAAILSGTRGIWAASLGAVGLAVVMIFFFKKLKTDIVHRRIFSYGASYLVAFFMLFAVAWSIFVSPQFLLGKTDLGLLGNRLRSVIDFGETSNALRIAIWKASLTSIVHHPLLGIGIGNFPVVLGQDIALARAGSTAHNLYLHVAAEMGIPAAIEMIILLVAAWLSTVRWFLAAQSRQMIYSGALILYLPWVLAYVLTDPIIFDERVFLLFALTLALVWANVKPKSAFA